MSSPSFSNIDLWLFELAEGNLSQEQTAQLELFLLQHPEFDMDKDVWTDAKVEKVQEIYPEQESLHRRKPVGFYSAIVSTAFILFTFVGCYHYFDLDSISSNKLASANSSEQIDERKLEKEIEELRATVNSLKLENSQLLAENLINQSAKLNINTLNSINGIESDGIESGGINASILSENYLNGEEINQSTNGVGQNSNSRILLAVASGLETNEVKNIDLKYFTPTINVKEFNKKKTKSKSIEYKRSFKSKMHKFSREVQRMLNNPVALKNYRDPHYHVPGKLPQEINFGSAGTLLATRVQSLSRLQWYGEENQQLMNQLSIDGYAYGVRGGLGLIMNHTMYNNGGIKVADVAIAYSPKLSITNKISLEPSIRFKMGNKNLNNDLMDGVSEIEMDRGNVHSYYGNGTQPFGKNLWYKDLGAGLMVNTKWFFAGIQADNLLHHTDNIYSNDITNKRNVGTEIIATIGTDWESRSENMSFSPYVVYRKNENLSEAWFGLNYRYEMLVIGGGISSNLDPAASIGLKLKHFSVTYNADYTRSYMTGNQSLSHQLSIRFLASPSRFGKRLLNK